MVASSSKSLLFKKRTVLLFYIKNLIEFVNLLPSQSVLPQHLFKKIDLDKSIRLGPMKYILTF